MSFPVDGHARNQANFWIQEGYIQTKERDMSGLRTLQYSFLLAVLGSQLSHAADNNMISALKAVPRGNPGCWVDAGGRLKNTCSFANYLSFMADFNANGRNVIGYVVTDAQITCESLSYSFAPQDFITFGPKGSNIPLLGALWSCQLPLWTSPGPMFQIDLKVPAGVTVFGAYLQGL